MCFQFGFKWTFDCKRAASLQSPESRALFNSADGSGVMSVIKNSVDKNFTIIFDKRIQESALYSGFNFDTFSVGKECFFEFEMKYYLIEGEYPKIVDGNYIKYTIPYVK
jgi:hypothetical protein